MRQVNKFVLAALAFAQVSAFAWHAPKPVAVQEICGTLSRTKTWYDGVQLVFVQLNAQSKPVNTHYLSPLSDSLKTQLAQEPLDGSRNVCVVGLAAGGLYVDSPAPFYTFEVLAQ